VHHYAWWRAAEDGVGAGLFYFPQAEEQLTVLSHYYDVPSVSLRAAVYPLMLHGVPGFRVRLGRACLLAGLPAGCLPRQRSRRAENWPLWACSRCV
jgi:hypothetical protein